MLKFYVMISTSCESLKMVEFPKLTTSNSDIFGHFGTYLDIFGHFGTFLDIFGHIGTYLDIFGHFGTFWDISMSLSLLILEPASRRFASHSKLLCIDGYDLSKFEYGEILKILSTSMLKFLSKLESTSRSFSNVLHHKNI